MTIDQMIKKWKMELAVQNGQEGIGCKGKMTQAQIEMVKEAKPEIIEELKRREAAREQELAELRAQREKEIEQKTAEYLATADLRRCLVSYQDENFNTTWSIQTLSFVDGKVFNPKYGDMKYVELAHVTETMKAQNDNYTEYGLGGVVWEITPEQEAQILAEQVPAEEEAQVEAEAEAQKNEEKEVAKETAMQAKFDEAKATGKQVLLRKWTEECCDPSEECSLDMHYEYAMPDGTTKHTWSHTW